MLNKTLKSECVAKIRTINLEDTKTQTSDLLKTYCTQRITHTELDTMTTDDSLDRAFTATSVITMSNLQ